MTHSLIKIWNDTVKEDDIVYFVGDFSLNPRYSRDIVPALNGMKHIIPGNHDGCFSWKNREERNKNQINKYLNDGWLSVNQTLELDLKNGMKVLLSHLPYLNTEYDQRYPDYRPNDNGLFLVHGHEHCRYLKNGRMIDVGIDNDFQLVSEDKLIELINDERSFIPSRLTEYYKELKTRDNMKGM